MCKICEAIPQNQQYVSPYQKPPDVYDKLTPEQIKDLTKYAIDAIVRSQRRQLDAERFQRDRQTSLY
jgi:hypothetical protein